MCIYKIWMLDHPEMDFKNGLFFYLQCVMNKFVDIKT